MKRFVLVIALLLSGVLFAEAKRNVSFDYKDRTYVAAVDYTKSYVEYEGVKFYTLFPNTNRKNPEVDYIVSWKGIAYIFSDAQYYNKMRYILDAMTTGKHPLKVLEAAGDSLVEGIYQGKAGRWYKLGYYDKNGFHPNETRVVDYNTTVQYFFDIFE